MEEFKVVAFIPAKGGSERIPRKNIKVIAGKPMLAWTIEACLKSKHISRTFVSTEDKEIKGVALQYGAEVVDRPAKYSEGEIDINFAYFDFIYHLWKEKYRPDYMVLLLPTMPLRTAKHIDEAYELMIEAGSSMICSVSESHYMPSNKYFIDKSGRLEHLFKDNISRTARNKIGDDYSIRPLMYNTNSVVNIGVFNGIDYLNYQYVEPVLPYIMSAEDSIDIDTPLDFKVAEMLLEERMKKEGG